MDSKKPDPEMLKEIEFLLNMEALDEESDWEALAQMDALENNKFEADKSEDEEGDK